MKPVLKLEIGTANKYGILDTSRFKLTKGNESASKTLGLSWCKRIKNGGPMITDLKD
jgi:hypothetical protein